MSTQEITEDENSECYNVLCRVLINASERDAKLLCKAIAVSCRTKSRDGQAFILTRDYKPDRLNFKVEHDLITEITRG